MRRVILISIVFVFCFSLGATATEIVVDNPGVPVTAPGAKKIDRVVKLTEVLRISDIGEDFFLKRPGKIRVGQDGSIFVMDSSQELVLKFDSRGKFQARMVKKGEGPGELVNLYGYWLGKDQVIACGLMPVKVVCMDHHGKMIKEFKVKAHEFLYTFMGRFAGKYYFHIDPLERGDGLKTAQIPLVYAGEKGTVTRTGLTLPVKRIRYTASVQRRGAKGQSELKVVIKTAHITRYHYVVTGNKYLYLSTDERYLVRKYDLETDKVVAKFRRPYTPVPYRPNPGIEFVNSSEFKALYKWEHYADVQRLASDGDRVWVFTSTIDKTKGILVDVFDGGGKYIDRFYLQIPKLEYPDDKVMEQFYYHDGFLYTIEADDEDNPNIVKYKLEG